VTPPNSPKERRLEILPAISDIRHLYPEVIAFVLRWQVHFQTPCGYAGN
jgi:hypothetical protein